MDEAVLRVQCWRMDLNHLIREDRRFRLFSKLNHSWMNPYSGQIVDDIKRQENGKVDQQTITRMAKYLHGEGISIEDEPKDLRELKENMVVFNQGKSSSSLSTEEAPISDDEHHLNQDLERASAVQARMLQDPPSIAGYELARIFRPHAAVSGDAYDLHMDQKGILHFLIADVAGTGCRAR